MRLHPMPALVLLLAACPAVEEDPVAEACGYVDGAAASLESAGTPEQAPALSPGETVWEASLSDAAPGWVAFELDEETDLTLLLDAAAVATGLERDGDEEDLGAPAPVADCPEVFPEHWDLELGAGRWALRLGPAALPSVRLVLLPSEGHGHE